MFNSINSVSGKDLNWFFNNWYFSNRYIVLAVQNVARTETGATVTIKNISGFDAPVNIIVKYDDGKSETFHQTPAIWMADQKQTSVNIAAKTKIKSLVLDGGIFMDVDTTDDAWETK